MARLHHEPVRYGATRMRGLRDPRAHGMLCERCGTDIAGGPNRKTRLCKDCKGDRLFNPPREKEEELDGADGDLHARVPAQQLPVHEGAPAAEGA